MNDEEAVLRCQDGDREAFRHLVESYEDVLYGTAYLMTGNTALAEEHVQEAFLSAWRGIRGFRTGRPVKPWLVRILVNTVMTQRRRQSVPVDPLNVAAAHSGAGDPAELAESIESGQRVRQAISALSFEHNTVVTLRFFAGLTVPQVAHALGRREGTIKSRLHRALQHLRRELEELGPGNGDSDE
ncbi:MAG: sigma-70 family RNA polymerase sigma factor [Chloroflexi bacterium]|nr:sigma-70 family RNA polymerase sigma factor [Chloroflexota bacterium]